MAAEIGGKQLSSLLESLPGIASVLRSPVADAMVNLIRAAAKLEPFHEGDAKELVHYATRRGLLGSDEGDELLAAVKGLGAKGRRRTKKIPKVVKTAPAPRPFHVARGKTARPPTVANAAPAAKEAPAPKKVPVPKATPAPKAAANAKPAPAPKAAAKAKPAPAPKAAAKAKPAPAAKAKSATKPAAKAVKTRKPTTTKPAMKKKAVKKTAAKKSAKKASTAKATKRKKTR